MFSEHWAWPGVRRAVAVRADAVGLERLQQLMDAMVDEGVVIRQHIYRVRDARDAHLTVHRHRATDWRLEDTVKHILVDLPTNQCEEFLKLQVSAVLATRVCSFHVRRRP